jgi:hypothetical protein
VIGFVVPFGDFAIDKAPLSAFVELSVRQMKWKGGKMAPTSQKPDHETHHPPYETFNIARKATRMTLIKQRQIGKI